MILPFDGGEPQRVKGAEAGDRPIQWSADGESIFVYKGGRVEVRSIASISDRAPVRDGMCCVRDPAGIRTSCDHMTRDGEKYAYRFGD